MTKLDSHETKTAFAARVGLTKGRISQLVAEGLPVQSDGRIDVVQADSYGLPTVSVTFTDFVPAPGHTYRITVTGRAADGSLTSLKVNAFYYDTTTEDYAINTQVSYDDITVQFRRTVMGGDPMTSSEQWITPA